MTTKIYWQVVRNGPDDILIVREIKEHLPPCYVDGLEYKFNSKIIYTRVLSKTQNGYGIDHELYLKLLDTCENVALFTAVQQSEKNQ
jgi:hypothetical protein